MSLSAASYTALVVGFSPPCLLRHAKSVKLRLDQARAPWNKFMSDVKGSDGCIGQVRQIRKVVRAPVGRAQTGLVYGPNVGVVGNPHDHMNLVGRGCRMRRRK